ncbi:MAG TPA: sigma-70 family RNA polymerase sigma factor [Chitinophaga sp.]
MVHVPDDEILLIGVTDRHRAFELAFQQYWQPLFMQAYKKVQQEDIAKDLVQEVFVAFWHNLGQLPPDARVLPYLYGILRNKVLQHYEKNEVRLRYAMKMATQAVHTETSGYHLLLDKELQKVLADEVARMPERMRAIYLLRRDQALSIKDMAAQLALSEQTIKNQLHSATTRLRECIRRYEAPLLVTGLLLLADLARS